MVKLKDIAEAADVSICTVSKILNGGKNSDRYSQECRQRVLEISQRMGYRRNHAARSLRRGKTDIIGLLLPEWFGTGRIDPFSAALLAATESVIREHKMQTLIFGADNQEQLLNALGERRVDGILASAFNPQKGLIDILSTSGLPTVLLYPENTSKIPTVRLDMSGGVRLAVEKLAQLGHKKIAWVDTDKKQRIETARENSFKETCDKHGISHTELPDIASRDWDTEIEQVAMLTEKQGVAFWREYTGAVCFHDPAAFGVMEGIKKLGLRVPNDVSVIGFDNILSNFSYPRLTSVDFMFNEVATAGMELLLEWIRTKQQPTQSLILLPELGEGASIAPPPVGN